MQTITALSRKYYRKALMVSAKRILCRQFQEKYDLQTVVYIYALQIALWIECCSCEANGPRFDPHLGQTTVSKMISIYTDNIINKKNSLQFQIHKYTGKKEYKKNRRKTRKKKEKLNRNTATHAQTSLNFFNNFPIIQCLHIVGPKQIMSTFGRDLSLLIDC